MIDVQRLKDRVCECIDSHREEILAIGEDIRRHPELGFKEFRTAGIVANRCTALGIPHTTGIAVTGLRGMLRGAEST